MADPVVSLMLKICRAIVADDYAALISVGLRNAPSLDWYGATDPQTYELSGEYEWDSRHVYPDRARLIDAVLAVAIERLKGNRT